MTIVAEGVETQEQLACLRTEGCHEVQGYLFSRPRPAEDVFALIAQDWGQDETLMPASASGLSLVPAE